MNKMQEDFFNAEPRAGSRKPLTKIGIVNKLQLAVVVITSAGRRYV